MHCCSRLQASESLQSKLSCVPRTWACEVTKKPTSSTKTEKRRRKRWTTTLFNKNRRTTNAEKKRTLKLKKKKEVHYIQRKHPHVSLRNFVAPSNISWMTIAKCLPTKYWQRLSWVLHGGAQRLQKLKAPLKTKPTKKKMHLSNFVNKEAL